MINRINPPTAARTDGLEKMEKFLPDCDLSKSYFVREEVYYLATARWSLLAYGAALKDLLGVYSR